MDLEQAISITLYGLHFHFSTTLDRPFQEPQLKYLLVGTGG